MAMIATLGFVVGEMLTFSTIARGRGSTRQVSDVEFHSLLSRKIFGEEGGGGMGEY
jgi:hypothetical protein